MRGKVALYTRTYLLALFHGDVCYDLVCYVLAAIAFHCEPILGFYGLCVVTLNYLLALLARGMRDEFFFCWIAAKLKSML